MFGGRAKPKDDKANLLTCGWDALETPVMIADAGFRIVHVNKAARDFLKSAETEIRKDLPQFDADQLTGKSIDIFHKASALQRDVLEKASAPHKTSIRLGDMTFGLTMTAMRDPMGAACGFVAMWEDTSVLDMAGQLAAINTSQAVIQFKLDGTILDANKNFLAAVGYSLDEIKGRHHRMFVDSAYAAGAEYHEFWAKLNKGEYQSARYKRLGKGGREIWIEASYNPVFGIDGRPFKVVKYATDITARKNATHKLSIQVSEMVSALSASAAELRATAEGLTEGARDTSHKSEAVAAATDKLSAVAQEIARQISEASRVVGGAVDEAVQSEEKVTSLLSSAESVGAITSVIAQIAGQTNLLALNATIEAARAGDAGKGFAVVASEVKGLAAQTAKATGEIGQQIKGIQQSSGATAATIRQIADVIGKVSDISLSISTAINEQSAVTREVSDNIGVVRRSSQEASESAASLLSVSADLANRASDLEKLVANFAVAL